MEMNNLSTSSSRIQTNKGRAKAMIQKRDQYCNVEVVFRRPSSSKATTAEITVLIICRDLFRTFDLRVPEASYVLLPSEEEIK